MSFIIFIVLLALLILVHELGHFLSAKSVGARVDEFGIGFPPRLYAWKKEGSETTYSINWIPFGGFVKILGEDGASELTPEEKRVSLDSKNPLQKIWVLSAGVIFNALFAWIIFSLSFMSGLPSVVTPDTKGVVGTTEVTILEVAQGSPAEEAGIIAGDIIVSFDDGMTDWIGPVDVEDVQTFIGGHSDRTITLEINRGGNQQFIDVIPETGIVPGRGAIGVSLDLVGIVKLSPLSAIAEGGKTTLRFIGATVTGLYHLIANALTGNGSLSDVSGPVGIIGMVGDASERGFMAILTFAAVISINLAVINLIPFPALDGGRILFVLLETITRRKLPIQATQWMNLIGFSILIILMVVITVHDVIQLVS